MVGLCWLTGWNFNRSLIDASFSSRIYSNLSLMTTPVSSSGLVITMSSRFYSFWINRRSVSGGFGPFLSMQFKAIERRAAAARSFFVVGKLGFKFPKRLLKRCLDLDGRNARFRNRKL